MAQFMCERNICILNVTVLAAAGVVEVVVAQ